MTSDDLESWLIERLAERLKVPAIEIDPERPLEEYGFDSMEAVALTGELEVLLEATIEPTAIWDYPSVRALAEYLSQARSEPIHG